MKLFWLGHACFLVEQDGYTILLDPYTGVEEFLELWPREQVHRLGGPLCEITGGCSGVLVPRFSEEG